MLTDRGFEVNVIDGSNTYPALNDVFGEVFYKFTQFEAAYDQLFFDQFNDGDIIIASDAWNFAILPLKYMLDVLGISITFMGIWRGGMYDKYSVIRNTMLRKNRNWCYALEKSLYHIYDYNLFISKDQERRFASKYVIVDGIKTHVTGLPYRGIRDEALRYYGSEKENTIVIPHNVSYDDQRDIIMALQHHFTDIEVVNCYEYRLNRDEYYQALSRAKIVLSISFAASDPTHIYEALLFDCIPLVPDAFIYPDIIPLDDFHYPATYMKAPLVNFIKSRDIFYDNIKDKLDNYLKWKNILPFYLDSVESLYFDDELFIELLRKIEIKD